MIEGKSEKHGKRESDIDMHAQQIIYQKNREEKINRRIIFYNIQPFCIPPTFRIISRILLGFGSAETKNQSKMLFPMTLFASQSVQKIRKKLYNSFSDRYFWNFKTTSVQLWCVCVCVYCDGIFGVQTFIAQKPVATKTSWTSSILSSSSSSSYIFNLRRCHLMNWYFIDFSYHLTNLSLALSLSLGTSMCFPLVFHA